jgi:hypothetical protein
MDIFLITSDIIKADFIPIISFRSAFGKTLRIRP